MSTSAYKKQFFLLIYLTRQAVDPPAHRTPELIDIILEDAPSFAIRRLAMKRLINLILRLRHRFRQILVVNRRTNQRLDLPILQGDIAGILLIPVRAHHLGFFSVFHRVPQTHLAELVQALPKGHPGTWGDLQEADHALERLRVLHQVRVVQVQELEVVEVGV